MTRVDLYGRALTNSHVVTSERLITGPTVEPLDLDEVKKALRFTSTSEDTLIDLWIAAARQQFEELTGRQLMAATWEYELDAYPASLLELPHPPLLDVVSITHPDSTVWDDSEYLVTTPTGPYASPGRVVPVSGSWPSVSATGLGSGVVIRYRAGYGTVRGAVPELIKGALLFLVGHFHKHRAETFDQAKGTLTQIPIGFEYIVRSFKYQSLATYALRRQVGVA